MLVFYNLLEQAWFNGILVAVGVGVSALIAWGFATFQAWLSSKIKNEKVKQVSMFMLDLIQDVVSYVTQTFVEQLKKDGKFDKAAQEQALALALERVKANMTTEAHKVLEELYGDVDTWLTTQVEAIIVRGKRLF